MEKLKFAIPKINSGVYSFRRKSCCNTKKIVYMKLFVAGGLFVLGSALFAASPDSLSTTDLKMPDAEVSRMDSMLEAMFASNPSLEFHEADYRKKGYAPTDVPTFTPEIYAERISRINTPIPLEYNDKVQAFIDLYCVRKRDKVSNMLTIGQEYFPMIEAELDRRGLPLELKYVAVIESALNTHAVSKAGATGLWQLMYGTGKLMGLQIDTYVDERRDPFLATKAGIAYLDKMYNVYGDWLLAIAAYNCGPGNVNKAIRRSGGGEKTFWEIWKYLPAETRAYVPIFIAATYTFEYHQEHNIEPAEFGYQFEMVDTILITRKLKLEDIAPFVNKTTDALKVYNPALKTTTIPGSPTPYPLRMPMDAVALFISNQEQLYAQLDQPKTTTTAPVEPVAVNNTAPAKTSTPDTNDKNTYVYYTVKKGDNLGYISEWFNCSVADLKTWNNMRSTKIMSGQKLKIYVPADHKSEYAAINTMSFSEKQKLSNVQMVQGGEEKKASEVVYYTVRPGDTLWSIAKRYPENTIEGIQELNAMGSKETLQAGAKIKIVK